MSLCDTAKWNCVMPNWLTITDIIPSMLTWLNRPSDDIHTEHQDNIIPTRECFANPHFRPCLLLLLLLITSVYLRSLLSSQCQAKAPLGLKLTLSFRVSRCSPNHPIQVSIALQQRGLLTRGIFFPSFPIRVINVVLFHVDSHRHEVIDMNMSIISVFSTFSVDTSCICSFTVPFRSLLWCFYRSIQFSSVHFSFSSSNSAGYLIGEPMSETPHIFNNIIVVPLPVTLTLTGDLNTQSSITTALVKSCPMLISIISALWSWRCPRLGIGKYWS